MFVASIIRNRLCIIYEVFYHFFQKSLLTENYFLIDAIKLATRGPLYTCLVLSETVVLTSTNVKDQLIRGINNSSLQIDVLTFVLKFETLNTLEKILKHVEAFETALSDQSKLSEGKTPDVGSLDTPK